MAKQINAKKALFWDNDGILVDTERYYFEATRRIMEREGFQLTKEMYISFFLIQSTGAWHLLDDDKYTPEKINDLKSQRNTLYHEMLMKEKILIDGIEEIVAALSKKYRMAIVTSSKPDHFYVIHSRTSLLKYFEFVVTPNDYTKYKPDPEPYITAIQKMGIKNYEGIAIEDSRRGLLAAKAAGLDCIIIKNELTETSDFSEADLVLTGIKELFKVLI